MEHGPSDCIQSIPIIRNSAFNMSFDLNDTIRIASLMTRNIQYDSEYSILQSAYTVASYLVPVGRVGLGTPRFLR
eukprot:820757-Prorocentrum_minimum.AAC.2